MEITIGIRNIAREISLEISKDPEQITSSIASALADAPVLSLTDDDGTTTLVPTSAIGFVQIGGQPKRFVGFSA